MCRILRKNLMMITALFVYAQSLFESSGNGDWNIRVRFFNVSLKIDAYLYS